MVCSPDGRILLPGREFALRDGGGGEAAEQVREKPAWNPATASLTGPGRGPATASKVRRSGFLWELDVNQDTAMIGAGHSYGTSHRHCGSPGNQYMIQAHNG